MLSLDPRHPMIRSCRPALAPLLGRERPQIWVMNAATGGILTRITHTTTQEKYPAWSH